MLRSWEVKSTLKINMWVGTYIKLGVVKMRLFILMKYKRISQKIKCDLDIGNRRQVFNFSWGRTQLDSTCRENYTGDLFIDYLTFDVNIFEKLVTAKTHLFLPLNAFVLPPFMSKPRGSDDLPGFSHGHTIKW